MQNLQYRPYQEECLDAIESAGAGKHLIALATGLGKTVIFTGIPNRGRTLILSHRDELVRQPEKYYKGRGISFGIEKADEHANGEDIVSASIQSLSQDTRLNSYAADTFDTVIVDEAHHAAAPTYRKVLDHFSGATRILGFTATPKRGDDIGLSCVFDDIIFDRDIRWGITHGYLSRIRCEEIRGQYSLAGITKTNGDYSATQVEAALLGDNELGVIPVAAKTYIEKCHNAGKHTIIYCVTKRICMVLAETLKKSLPKSEHDTIRVILGDTPGDERTKALADFQSGSVRCLINCMVLTEGTDLPICDAILNLRPTCRNTLYQQMVGRGTRLYSEKEYCLVIDIIPDNIESSPRSLCTAPTLFGLDPKLLSPGDYKKLTEDEDLLEFCDRISLLCKEASERIAIISQNVNRFVEETEHLFAEARNKDISILARNLNAQNKNQLEGVDLSVFGDLNVEVFPDERKRYRIRPNWDEEIWISEPDVLDDVIIQFHLNKKYDPSKRNLTAKMKLQDAVQLAYLYCVAQPDYLSYSWSQSARRVWGCADATEAQKHKLFHTYLNQDIHVPPNVKFNKLEASNLIDLSMEYKRNLKLAEAFKQAESGKKTKKAATAKILVDSYVKESSGEITLTKPEVFQRFKNEICLHGENMIKTQVEKKKQEAKILEEAKSNHIMPVLLTCSIGKGLPATPRQIGFVKQLRNETGVFLDKKETEFDRLTRRQISLMIEFLLTVKKLPEQILLHTTFPDAWKTCLQAEKTGEVSFNFKKLYKE